MSDRSGKAQIWVIDAAGGEAWRFVTEEAILGVPVWSPGGKYIAFSSRDFAKAPAWTPYPGAPEWDRERAIAQARQATSGKSPKEDEAKTSDVKVITRLRYRFDGIGYFGDLRSHIFIVAVPDLPGEAGEVMGNPRRLTSGDYDHDSPSFSPDGRYIAFSAVRRDDADYIQKSDLWLVEVATGRLVQLLEGTGPCSQPRWCPDGSRIAFSGHDGAYDGSNTPYLWVLDVGDFLSWLEGAPLATPAPLRHKDARNVTLPMDRPIGAQVSSDMRHGSESAPFQWIDAATLMFVACDRGAAGLYAVSASGCSGGEIATVFYERDKCVAGFDKRGGNLVVQVGSASTPDELFILDRDEAEGACYRLRKLTDTCAWLCKYDLGDCERFTYKGDKGWDIDG